MLLIPPSEPIVMDELVEDMVVLDPYQISTIEGSNEENTKAAFDYLRKHNSNDITK